MLKSLSSREVSEWMVYEAMEPFGERAEYLRSGILAAMLYNVNRGPEVEAMRPEDFMPETLREQMAPMREEQSPALKLAKALGLTPQLKEPADG